ncbi:hypothetical protein OSB04_019074 [Centaurea solstitialis]|uniref:Uncharacterized protein n=1 Tax=Centaurea solstitialis TaxID=347529 RepID=A0AA38WFI8_9ASTR|nr:hypothetical protein OSB04_019074 [Centaurea solstitialis]
MTMLALSSCQPIPQDGQNHLRSNVNKQVRKLWTIRMKLFRWLLITFAVNSLPSPNVKTFMVPTPPLPSIVSMDLKTSGLILGAMVSKSLNTLKTLSAGNEEGISISILKLLYDSEIASPTVVNRFWNTVFGWANLRSTAIMNSRKRKEQSQPLISVNKELQDLATIATQNDGYLGIIPLENRAREAQAQQKFHLRFDHRIESYNAAPKIKGNSIDFLLEEKSVSSLPSPNVKTFMVPTPPLPSIVSMDLKTSGLTLGAMVSKSLNTLKTLSAGNEEGISISVVTEVMIY